ncbi:hypothetical protein IRZ71_22205 [Flavobacterium sp. ANB]|uniref:hypothetical protein n=1 Tax=unclassified Flavobacterium TaxID=196869 RepID=UPI0012B6D5EF|nr:MULTISPECIES: hypothetical protein [unclassified Flavobacterium]MBF4519075.1 hypothetical protein [Flavobacterium sp. ANB]MTD71725.1 hypothetical protein [Flavobacterium sp. LC2016-13]
MIPDVYKTFIQAIIQKTNDDEAKWETTRDEAYVLRTSSATVEVGHYIDQDAEVGYYYFKYYNIKKKTDAGFRVNNLEDDYPTMERLFAIAAASAANIKDELSSFLGDL